MIPYYRTKCKTVGHKWYIQFLCWHRNSTQRISGFGITLPEFYRKGLNVKSMVWTPRCMPFLSSLFTGWFKNSPQFYKKNTEHKRGFKEMMERRSKSPSHSHLLYSARSMWSHVVLKRWVLEIILHVFPSFPRIINHLNYLLIRICYFSLFTRSAYC